MSEAAAASANAAAAQAADTAPVPNQTDPGPKAGFTPEQAQPAAPKKPARDRSRATLTYILAKSRADRAQAIHDRWVSEAEALRAQYPDFLLKEELADPTFTGMLRVGVPLRTAYQARHLDAILEQAAQSAAQQAAAEATRRAAALAARPAENGVTPGAAAFTTPDVNSLTRAQREQLERRAAKGETIRF